jgi:cytochrome c oxidase assembly protein subunit 15
VRWLSVGALGAVIAQGVLGGLTVIFWLPVTISMAHATLAQTFFCLTIALALATSPSWKRGLPIVKERHPSLRLPMLCTFTTAAVYVQLLIGALMRHTMSGLSIPDFPLAFGKVIPPFTSYHVAIHFAHRVGALVVASLIVWTFVRVRQSYREHTALVWPATAMFVLVWIQLTLGAFTIWTEKEVFVATAHVATGALVLGSSFLLTFRAYGMVRDREPAAVYNLREATWR